MCEILGNHKRNVWHWRCDLNKIEIESVTCVKVMRLTKRRKQTILWRRTLDELKQLKVNFFRLEDVWNVLPNLISEKKKVDTWSVCGLEWLWRSLNEKKLTFGFMNIEIIGILNLFHVIFAHRILDQENVF